MKVNTQSVNFSADKKLLDFIEMRMKKLNKVFDRVISTDVFLKVQKTRDKHNKIFEARVFVPGDSFMVKKVCRTFEEGTDSAISSLERQLKKRKQKIRAHL